MKKIILLSSVVFIFSCKNSSTDQLATQNDVTYPENVSKVFVAHGGMDTWGSFEQLNFEIEKPDGNDFYKVSLGNRKSLIRSNHHELGFDGKNVWLKNLDTVQYKRNPKFYYNLMFYFYAMPFVLGDDGINYKDVEPLNYQGVSYPGVLISYNAGIGESPEDEYILYYHPETHKMSWLAYTVTYFSKEKSKKFNLIRYDDWENVAGVDLPSSIQWHHYNDGEIGDVRNEVNFVKSSLSKTAADELVFKVPDSTMIVK